MPVSSPSYFPPNRTTDRIVGITAGTGQTGDRVFLAGQASGNYTTIPDLVLIGHTCMSTGTAAAPLTDATLTGTICIGSFAGAALQFNNTTTEGNVVIGYKAAATANFLGATTLIGWNIMPAANGGSGTVGRNLTAIGANSLQGGYGSIHECVIIGNDISLTPSGGNFSAFASGVYIGYNAVGAGPDQTGYGDTIVVGNSASRGRTRLQGCVIIGGNADTQGTFQHMTDCVAIGRQVAVRGDSSFNVCVGAFSDSGNGGNFNVVLGYGANLPLSTYNDTLLIEVALGGAGIGTASALLFGSFSSGNLIVGNSTQATNRDFGGVGSSNILKILNGTIGNANPIGGGYFYVSGGALHWVGSAGTDTTIAQA